MSKSLTARVNQPAQQKAPVFHLTTELDLRSSRVTSAMEAVQKEINSDPAILVKAANTALRNGTQGLPGYMTTSLHFKTEVERLVAAAPEDLKRTIVAGLLRTAGQQLSPRNLTIALGVCLGNLAYLKNLTRADENLSPEIYYGTRTEAPQDQPLNVAAGQQESPMDAEGLEDGSSGQ